MRSAIALLTVFLLCYSANAGDDECKEQMMAMKKEWNKMIEEDTVPPCVKDLELTQFKCTAGEDPEKDKQVMEDFKKWMSNLEDDDKKKAVMECLEEFGKIVEESMGDQLTEDCKKKMKEYEEKMKSGNKE